MIAVWVQVEALLLPLAVSVSVSVIAARHLAVVVLCLGRQFEVVQEVVIPTGIDELARVRQKAHGFRVGPRADLTPEFELDSERARVRVAFFAREQRVLLALVPRDRDAVHEHAPVVARAREPASVARPRAPDHVLGMILPARQRRCAFSRPSNEVKDGERAIHRRSREQASMDRVHRRTQHGRPELERADHAPGVCARERVELERAVDRARHETLDRLAHEPVLVVSVNAQGVFPGVDAHLPEAESNVLRGRATCWTESTLLASLIVLVTRRGKSRGSTLSCASDCSSVP